MLARKWSLVSCSAGLLAVEDVLAELVDARIDATAGLQMSQPFPVP